MPVGARFSFAMPARSAKHNGEHADDSQNPDGAADLRVVIEKPGMGEKVIPVVLRLVRVADGYVSERLAARISHVRANGQKLLEKEKTAEGGAGDLSPQREIHRQREWNEQLKQGSAGDH